jgi:hypothetical protein
MKNTKTIIREASQLSPSCPQTMTNEQKQIAALSVLFFLACKACDLSATDARLSFMQSGLAQRWGPEFTVGELWELSELVY